MSRTSPYTSAETGAPSGAIRRISWGGIIAGAVIAAALMVLFTTFGVGIGTATIDPTGQSPSASTIGIGGGIYTLVTQIVSLGIGGFVAARLAGMPRTVTSVLHGATVWAVTTLFLVTAAIMGGSALFGAASNLAGNAARGATSVTQAIVPDDLSLPDPAEIANQISFDALPDELRQTLEEEGITPQNLQQEAQQAFREAISEQEQEAIVAEARETLTTILGSPGTAGDELQAFLDETLAGPQAVLNDQDRQQALAALERRTGLAPEDAEQIVAQVETRIGEGIDEVRNSIDAARQQALETAEAATNATTTAALLLALASILGLAAACAGAASGRPNAILGERRGGYF